MRKFPQADRMMRPRDMMNRDQNSGSPKVLPLICPNCRDWNVFESAEALRAHREKFRH